MEFSQKLVSTLVILHVYLYCNSCLASLRPSSTRSQAFINPFELSGQTLALIQLSACNSIGLAADIDDPILCNLTGDQRSPLLDKYSKVKGELIFLPPIQRYFDISRYLSPDHTSPNILQHHDDSFLALSITKSIQYFPWSATSNLRHPAKKAVPVLDSHGSSKV